MTDECCKNNGIPFATPAEAVKGPREKVLFVSCPSYSQPRKPDAMVTVDVDPSSSTYCQVISKLDMPNVGDELHHFGWNACASCHGNADVKRRHLIAPGLLSNRIYVVHTEDPKNLKLTFTIEPEVFKELDVSFFHTTHCLPDGQVMISALGDNDGNNKGEFILLDSKTFVVRGKWSAEDQNPKFNYSFWYQPRLNVMMSTEWGAPKAVKQGFDPKHLAEGLYGNCVNIWDWKERKIVQRLNIEGPRGWLTFQLRFLHDPSAPHAFMATALGSAVYHLYRPEGSSEWTYQLIYHEPPKTVKNWDLPEMPALITDLLVSMDDKRLFVPLWLHGKILCFDISDPFNVKLESKIIVGGLLHKNSGIEVVNESFGDYYPTVIKGVEIQGGPHMLQLSLDGKRLYVTNSLNTVWDHQMYPSLVQHGSTMVQIDVDTDNGGMRLNENFLVDFGKLEGGPYAAQEMRYPVSAV